MTEKAQIYSLKDLAAQNAFAVVANVTTLDIDGLRGLLSVEERERADRFRRQSDTSRYIAAHALKRRLLANALAVDIQDLRFAKTEYGKPYCEMVSAPYFNLSHSGDWVAFIFSREGDVGIDVEFPRNVDERALLKKICLPEQVEDICESGQLSNMFWYLWSQKEAVSKANGRGLAIGVEGIQVSGKPGYEQVMCSSQNYHLWSQSFESGVLSCVRVENAQIPAIYRLSSKKGRLDEGGCCFYEL